MAAWRKQSAARASSGVPEGKAHGLNGYRTYGCRCNECGAAYRESQRDPKAKERAAARQAASLEAVRRYYTQWTGPELELAERWELTASQVAAMTGRTLSAVRNKRDKIRSADPKTLRVLGAQD